MFVQDSAPAHRAKTIREFLKKQLSFFVRKDVWPSSLPDLNPCDYCLWSEVEKMSNNKPHNTVSQIFSEHSDHFAGSMSSMPVALSEGVYSRLLMLKART